MGIPLTMYVRLLIVFGFSATLVASEAVKICPDGWFDADSLGCFKFLDSQVNLTWVEAQLTCELVGGYLAEPITSSQSMFLSELALLEGSFTEIGYWYIGLTDLGREGDWFWIHNDKALTDSLWAPNHPINRTSNREDCAMLVLKNNQVQWEDHDCLSPDVKHHAVAPVCQTETDASQTQTTTQQPETTTAFTCQSGWTEFNNSCYQFFGSFESWQNSALSCQSLGGHLTSVHSAEEDTFIQSLTNGGGKAYWIGGYSSPGGWVWSDQTQFDYPHLYDTDSGQCLFQSTSHYGDGWSSHTCISSFYYICKI